MDDLAIVEMTDAEARYNEGGGSMPSTIQMQPPQYGMGAMGAEGSKGAWYKNPTWLALMALGVAATGFVVYAATKKKN